MSEKTFTLYQRIKRVPKDTEARESCIFKEKTYSPESQASRQGAGDNRASRSHCSAAPTGRRHLRALLKRKYPLPFGNKAHNRPRASTFTAGVIGRAKRWRAPINEPPRRARSTQCRPREPRAASRRHFRMRSWHRVHMASQVGRKPGLVTSGQVK